MKIIKIDGEIGWTTTARDVKWELSRASGDIRVEISSPGGIVFEGVEIHNALKNYAGGQVEVVITSLAASIASYIALAGDVVKVHDNATYMIHNAHVWAGGDHHKLRKRADIVEGLSNIIAKRYIEVTGKDEDEIKKMMNEETFFYGEEIVEAGFATEIIATEDEKDAASAKALAHEQFVACMKEASERETDQDLNEVAAYLDEVNNNLEQPKPTDPKVDEEGATSTEADEKVTNSSKVNAIHARLKLKEKTHG